MSLTRVEESLLLAAYFRGMCEIDHRWVSSSDEIVTLSLFYTDDISYEDCASRFSQRGYVGSLYNHDGELTDEVATRYGDLIELLRERLELILGGGDFQTPADPTFTSCRLTAAGIELIPMLIHSFPPKARV